MCIEFSHEIFVSDWDLQHEIKYVKIKTNTLSACNGIRTRDILYTSHTRYQYATDPQGQQLFTYLHI